MLSHMAEESCAAETISRILICGSIFNTGGPTALLRSKQKTSLNKAATNCDGAAGDRNMGGNSVTPCHRLPAIMLNVNWNTFSPGIDFILVQSYLDEERHSERGGVWLNASAAAVGGITNSSASSVS